MFSLERKKKYRGIKTVVLLLFVLLSLFVFSTTCYAYVSEEYIGFCIDKMIENNTNNLISGCLTNFKNKSNAISNLTNLLNNGLSNSDSGQTQDFTLLNDYNLIALPRIFDTYTRIYFLYTNCSFDNGVSNLGYFNYKKTQIVPLQGSYYIQMVQIYQDGSGGGNLMENRFTTNYTNNELIGQYSVNGELISISNVINYVSTQSIYVSADNLNKYFLLSSPTNTYLNVYPPTPPEPDEPSGDDGGGGTVTPSGDDGGSSNTPDYTNQLNDINSNISNSTTAITNQISGDTQKITNSIDNLNNTLTSPADMDNTRITSGDIERCFRL